MAPGDLLLDVHVPISLSMDGVNVRKVDIAITPNQFSQFLAVAPKYLRYRVESLTWRFFGSVPVAYQQGTNPVYPLRVYHVPLESAVSPATSETAFLNYDRCRNYVFVRDIFGRSAPYSPVDGALNTTG